MTTYTTVEKLYQDKNDLTERNRYDALTAFDAMKRMNIMTRIDGYLDVLEFDAVRLGDTS